MKANRFQIANRSLRRMQAVVLLIATLLMPLQSLAQNAGPAPRSVLQAGDMVQLAVAGRPDLNLVLTLDEDGAVVVPQVGQVTLAGLSVDDAGRILRQRFRLFDPTLDLVTVDVVNSNAMTIQVQGAVVNPGIFAFKNPPSVWELARMAGGMADNAEPGLARVIREEDGSARVLPLNLRALVSGGRIPDFTFQAGDILMVPQRDAGATSVVPEAGVQVFGAVGAPAVVHLSAPQPLLEVLMLAGSPRADAELAKIWLVHPEEGRFRSSRIDLKLFLEQGDPTGNPLVYPGDTLQISYIRDGWMRRNGTLVLGSLTAIATLFLTYDRIVQ